MQKINTFSNNIKENSDQKIREVISKLNQNNIPLKMRNDILNYFIDNTNEIQQTTLINNDPNFLTTGQLSQIYDDPNHFMTGLLDTMILYIIRNSQQIMSMSDLFDATTIQNIPLKDFIKTLLDLELKEFLVQIYCKNIYHPNIQKINELKIFIIKKYIELCTNANFIALCCCCVQFYRTQYISSNDNGVIRGELINLKMRKYCYAVFEENLNQLFYEKNFNFIISTQSQSITYIYINDKTKDITNTYISQMLLNRATQELLEALISPKNNSIQKNIKNKVIRIKTGILNKLTNNKITDPQQLKNIQINPQLTIKIIAEFEEIGLYQESGNIICNVIMIIEGCIKNGKEDIKFNEALESKINGTIMRKIIKPVYKNRNNFVHISNQSSKLTPHDVLFSVYTVFNVLSYVVYIKEPSEYQTKYIKHYWALRPDIEATKARIQNTKYIKYINAKSTNICLKEIKKNELECLYAINNIATMKEAIY